MIKVVKGNLKGDKGDKLAEPLVSLQIAFLGCIFLKPKVIIVPSGKDASNYSWDLL